MDQHLTCHNFQNMDDYIDEIVHAIFQKKEKCLRRKLCLAHFPDIHHVTQEVNKLHQFHMIIIIYPFNEAMTSMFQSMED